MTESVVELGIEGANVFIDFRPDRTADLGEIHYVTPSKARILANALIQCADEAEGNMPQEPR